ncbi:MAG: hypothetical protein CNLJKLNK_00640 [Holosporales bacterium]
MKILILTVIMGMLSNTEASSLKMRPEPLDLSSVQESATIQKKRAYERAEEESLKRIIEIEDDIQESWSPKVTERFKKCCGLLCVHIPSYQDKEKVWDFVKEVDHLKYQLIIDSNRILIKEISNPTILDRLNIIEALTIAPLSSHLPYSKFVELCLSLKTSTYSFSSLVLALSNVDSRLWQILHNYAESFGGHKAHVASILSHLLFEQWERATVKLSERLSLLETMPINDIIMLLNEDVKK